MGITEQFKKWRRNSTSQPIQTITTTEERLTFIEPPKKKKSTPEYPPSPDNLLQGIGDYTFIKQVGQGKFSKVILSYHYLTKQHVAIKVIDKRIHEYSVMSRLVREIGLMEILDHPNLVRLYETFETTDSLFIVLEYVEGLNLEEYLQKNKLSEMEAKLIFRQMVVAMDYCHSKWVVHRDIKAPNILLTKDNQVKIADFGLGNRYGRRRLKTMCGSKLYYSPEIINSQGYVGPEVDCWCLGVTLYRMTVGEEPFSKAKTMSELTKNVSTGNFQIPDKISPELKNTILKCMSLDKNKRSGIHIALKDDPWLTNNGRLPIHFRREGIDSEDKMKTRFLRDLEEEKKTKHLVKKTVVCHPKTPSIYFTSVVQFSSKPEKIMTHSETQRHLHFQKVSEISSQIQLRPDHNPSPIRHLLRKIKPDGPPNENRQEIHKSNSNMSLSQLYQRMTKDQVHYYSFKLTPHLALTLTGVGESSISFQTSQQDESIMMLVIQGICNMMGITYHRVKNDRLVCIMVLNDYIQDNKKSSLYSLKRRDSKLLLNPSDTNSQASLSRISAGLSDSTHNNNKSGYSRFSKFKRATSHVFSSILHQQSSVLESRTRYPIHSNRSVLLSQSIKLPDDPQSTDPQSKKAGVSVFAIDIISLSKDIKRCVGVKLSKLDGSSKVFRIACGWITGTIGQHNLTTVELSHRFHQLMIYEHQTKPSLSRTKSATDILFTDIPSHSKSSPFSHTSLNIPST